MTALAFPLPEGYSWYRNGLLLSKEISNEVSHFKKNITSKDAKIRHQTHSSGLRNRSDSDRITAEGAVLNIRQTERYDAGEYECEAFNSEGNSRATLVLNVLCKYSRLFFA